MVRIVNILPVEQKGGFDVMMNSKHFTQYWLNIILSIIHQIFCIALCRLETIHAAMKGHTSTFRQKQTKNSIQPKHSDLTMTQGDIDTTFAI